ncbi:cation transporter [Candidatus Saccharibacteria bacterium]|nr:cation transporter [Candidatus Saccharibacteria bacterium]
MATREQKIVKVGLLGIFLNLFLVIIKGLLGFFSGSIAILLDALNNLTDIFSAAVTVVGTKLATRAPDKNHPYGHGRLEDLTAFLIGLIIFAAGFNAIVEAAPKILAPETAHYSPLSLVLLLVAVVLKFLFSRHARLVGKQIDSTSLVATGTDAFFDSLLTFSTFLAAISSLFFSVNIEGLVGAVIGAFIIKNSLEILRDTARSLVGMRADEELIKKIKKIITRFPEVEGAYDLMVHNYGPVDLYGSIHIQVRDDMTAKEIHRLSREISAKVYDKLGVVLTIGVYAKNAEDEKYVKLKSDLEAVLKNYPEVLQMHGFYADQKSRVVAFDLVLDFSCQDKERVKSEVIKSLKKLHPEYSYQITLEVDIS